MNKKAMLKELLKDETVKALYKEDCDKSIIHKLILEELTEAEEQEIKDIEDLSVLFLLRRKFATLERDSKGAEAMRAQEKKDEVIKRIRELKNQPTVSQQQSVPTPSEEEPVVPDDTPPTDLQPEVEEPEYAEERRRYGGSGFMQGLDEEQSRIVYKFIFHYNEGIEDLQEMSVTIQKAFNALGKAGLSSKGLINAFQFGLTGEERIKFLEIIKGRVSDFANMLKADDVEDLDSEEVSSEEYTSAIVTTAKDPNNTEKFALIKSKTTTEKEKIAALVPLIKQVQQDTRTKNTAKDVAKDIIGAHDKFAKEQLPPTTIGPADYNKVYETTLESAFDFFEDQFLETPYLGIQSDSLFGLKDALNLFSTTISGTGKQSFNEGRQQVNEETQYPITIFSPKEKKLIMSEHKEMEMYLKMLAKLVKEIDEEKINTIGFEEDSRKIRIVAKKLFDSMGEVLKIIDSAIGEKRKGIEFNESLTEEEQPRTQLTRDQIIGLMEDGYAKLVDHVTQLEQQTRQGSEAISIEDTMKRIESAGKIVNKLSPYFPVSSPFGKETGLKEIKKQVRGVVRDIIQIMNQSKKLVKRPEDFDETSLNNFKQVLTSAVAKLKLYFDLDINDREILAMLPKVPPANSAAYGINSSETHSRLEKTITKIAAPMKQIYDKTKDKKGAMKAISKFFKKAFAGFDINRATKEVIINRILKSQQKP